MYREHLLSIDHVQKLLYHQVDTPDDHRSLRAPPFFVAQTDKGFKGSFSWLRSRTSYLVFCSVSYDRIA
jgi:hypothetical protein